jgi:hypothetical protein
MEDRIVREVPKFSTVPVSYFYDGEAPPEDEPIPPELSEMLRRVPMAEVLAGSIEEYQSREEVRVGVAARAPAERMAAPAVRVGRATVGVEPEAPVEISEPAPAPSWRAPAVAPIAPPLPAPKPAPPAALPVEYSPAPENPLRAVPLTDVEFNAIVRGRHYTPDPVAAWLWRAAAPGPLTVAEYHSDGA